MRNTSAKLIATCMAILTLITSSFTAQAAETTYETYSPDVGTAQTDVYLDVPDSEILVSVPKTVIVSGTIDETDKLYKGHYAVSVKGDWSGSNIVNVVPDETVELSQAGKPSVTASIEQDKTSWKVSETDEIATGLIATDKLSAGSWNGNFNFNISYGQTDGIPEGYSVLYKYDLSATSADDVAAYYCVPNENTTPIEVSEQSKVARLLSALSDNSNIVEYNGVRYELSDDDTLIISGEGKMKNSVYKDLYDLAGVSNNVVSKYTVNQELAKEIYETKNPKRTFTDAEFCGVTADCYGKISAIHIKYNDTYHWGENVGYTANTIPNGLLIDSNGNGITGADLQSYVNSIIKSYTISLPKKIIIKSGVTNISDNAFDGCKSIEEVEIGNTVKSIGARAFALCNSLSKVNFPDSLETIGSTAFGYTNLTEIKLGKSMQKIGGSAFSNCTKLTNVDLGPSVQNLEGGTFDACWSLKYVKAPLSLTYIGSNSFPSGGGRVDYEGTYDDWCKVTLKDGASSLPRFGNKEGFYANGELIENVTLHNEDIGNYAFYNYNRLKSVEFAPSVHRIGMYALSGTGLTTVTVPSTVTVYDFQMFSNCTSLKSAILNFDHATDELDTQWFYKCVELEDVTFSNNIPSIPSYTFYGCSKLKDFHIPTSATAIGNYAFYGCANITELDLPDGVKTIGDRAFYGSGLNKISLSSSLTKIGSYAFYGLGITSINFPNNLVEISEAAFRETALESIEIPNSLTTIGKFAFESCESLKKVKLPNSLETVGDNCFKNCTKLKTVGGVDSGCDIEYDAGATIPSYLFAHSNIESVTIPNTVNLISNNAFYACNGLKTVRIPNGVTEVGSSAFGSSSSIETVYLPNSLTKINSSAFTSMAEGSTIYCESQAVADLLAPSGRASKYTASKTTVIVDASKF